MFCFESLTPTTSDSSEKAAPNTSLISEVPIPGGKSPVQVCVTEKSVCYKVLLGSTVSVLVGGKETLVTERK